MEYSSGRLEEDTAGMGRSYECVFCKRGFTTAQALGGHMNIHRKDRAKNSNIIRPSTNPSTGLVTDPRTVTDDNACLKSYSPAIQTYPSTYLHGYFPVSAAAQYCHGHREPHHYGSSAPVDCSWSLSLQQVGSSRIDDHDDVDDDDDDDRNGYGNRRGGFVGGEQELDLELRLGHGHGHGRP